MKHTQYLLRLGLCAILQISPPLFAQTTSSANTYPVQPGDLIWDIAMQVRPDASLSRYQVMQALLAANPQAFSISCNINSPLKIGETLRIPSIETIQQLSKTEARQQFVEQATVWKNMRGRRNDIECPPPVSPSASASMAVTSQAKPQPAQTTPPTAYSFPDSSNVPTTVAPTTALPPPLSPVIVPATVSTPLNLDLEPTPPAGREPAAGVAGTRVTDAPKVDSDASSMPPASATSTTTVMQLLETVPLWLIGLLGGLVLLVLGLLLSVIILLLRRKQTTSPANNIAVSKPSKMSTAVWGELPVKKKDEAAQSPTASATSLQLPTYELVERQLGNIRTCLAAEGETQAVRVLLRDVMNHGTETQQAQAQQLLEIGRKMHWLEERNGRSPPSAVAASSEPPEPAASPPLETYAAAETVDKPPRQGNESSHFSLQRYLPEEQARVFELVDKIFELLDDELEADGRLVEAYVKRQHPDDFWDSRNYKVIDKIQTPFPDPPISPLPKGRDAKNNPRYL